MRLVLHIGPTKTASTSLQLSLQTNENLLAQHGIYLPHAGRIRRTSASHHNLAWQFTRDQRFRPDRGLWGDMLAEVREADPAIALLSSEAFTRIAAGKRRPFWVKALREADCPVELIYVVREPLARINSMYTQVVKTFGAADSFAEYAKEAVASGLYNLDKSFKFWYSGNRPFVRDTITFTAVRFDEFVRRSPLESLLDVLHTPVPTADLRLLDWEANVSPGPMAVVAFRLLGSQLRTADSQFDRRSTAASETSQIAQRAAIELGWFEERYWGWDAEAAKITSDRLARSNERFANAVWGDVWPFPPPLDRPTSPGDLAHLGAKARKGVMVFVDHMTSHYLKLLRRQASGAVPQEHEDDPTPESDDVA